MPPSSLTAAHRGVLALALLALAVPTWAAAGADDSCDAVPRAGAGGGVPANHEPSLVDACMGKIRPGAPMAAPSECTFNFVFTDAQANLYIGTAGHCVDKVGRRVATNQVGHFGTVVFRTWGGPASSSDFALVLIDPEFHDVVDPTMCAWGGPIGLDPGSRLQHDAFLEYGWGILTSAAPATRAREHVEALRAHDAIEWLGIGSGGDSGAPLLNQAGYAVGIHTYGQTPVAGVYREGGPSIEHVLRLAREAVPTLELVPGDASSFENVMRGITY